MNLVHIGLARRKSTSILTLNPQGLLPHYIQRAGLYATGLRQPVIPYARVTMSAVPPSSTSLPMIVAPSAAAMALGLNLGTTIGALLLGGLVSAM